MNEQQQQQHVPGSGAPERPAEQIEVAPGTLALLGDVVFGAPLVPALLNAYLTDRGHDPRRAWKLKLLGAVIVSDEATQAHGGRAGNGLAP